MKPTLSNLAIETTRRCQYQCTHCLRGDSQNKDMPMEYVESLLSQVNDIYHILFTGGEPSLNPKCMLETLELCKKYKVDVGSFYVVTNGAKIPEDFAVACLRWYAYCDDKENCGVAMSNDYFHDVEGTHDTELLDGLSFFELRTKKTGAEDHQNLIIDGNAEDNMYDGTPPEDIDIDDIRYLDDEEVYLNCEGDIVIGCDWSYRRQKNNVLCRVQDFADTYERLRE